MAGRRPLHALTALLTASALVAAACGGDDATSTPTSPGETAAPTVTTDPDEPPATGEPPATDEPAPTTPPSDLPPCPVDALESASGPVEVVVWHTQTAEPDSTLTALAAAYNASQDKVRVRLESQGASYTELKLKFQAALPSRSLPALILFDDTSTREMADSGVVLPGQSCFDAAGVDLGDFGSMATSYYVIDGTLWPVAANPAGILLFYNKTHFEQAGLDPNDPPSTLAEVRAAAEALKAAGVSERPLVHELAAWKTEFWLTGAGAPLVNNDNGRGPGVTDAATLADNPVALELFTWFDDMVADGLLEPIPSADGQINHFLAMASQRSSMVIESSSAATSVEAFLAGRLDPNVLGEDGAPSPSGLDLGAADFPGLVPGNRTQMGGAAWYLLNTVPDQVQAAAWDFVTFINSNEAQVKLLTGGSFIPWRSSTLQDPEVVAYFESGLSGRWLRIAAEQLQRIDPGFPGPLIGPYDPETRDALEKAMESMLLSGASPQQALDQAQRDIDAALDLYNSF